MSLESYREPITIRTLISEQRLYALFQPICSIVDGEVFGYEGLIRGPKDSDLHTPAQLFESAAADGNTFALEVSCAETVISGFDRHLGRGRLFVNLSAAALVALLRNDMHTDRMKELIARGPAGRKLVIEITEHDRVINFAEVLAAATKFREWGVQFALDDFGDGRSSLRLWAELQPEFVKIDKYFTQGAGDHFQKLQMLRAVAQISEVLGGQLIAEGIETPLELAAVRGLGITFGQGYLIGRPTEHLSSRISDVAQKVIHRGEVAVLPAARYTRGIAFSAERLTLRVPSISVATTAFEASRIFNEHPEYPALAVVVDEQAVGLINRRILMETFARPFQKEIYGNRPCTHVMNPDPMHLEYNATFDESMAILISRDQSYLTDGFIVSQNGKYVGVGTGESLVRTMTEYRVEAARHANPLTFFPGNVPITEHIQSLLAAGNDFVCAYCDLNNFKPFNDQYGYWRGDEMILLLADIIFSNAAPKRDFVGHVGGDDFIVLFQSEDWTVRCESAIAQFNSRAIDLFDPEARERGGIAAEDRNGNAAFFPITTLAIGAVEVIPGQFNEASDVASAAAAAKRRAKKIGVGFSILNLTDLHEQSKARRTESEFE